MRDMTAFTDFFSCVLLVPFSPSACVLAVAFSGRHSVFMTSKLKLISVDQHVDSVFPTTKIEHDLVEPTTEEGKA